MFIRSKTRSYLLILGASAALALGAACSDDDDPESTPTSSPSPTATATAETPMPSTTPTATGTPPADDVEAGAIQALAEWIDVPADEISVRGVVDETWPNACMGVEVPGEACAEVVTEGQVVELMVGDTEGGPQLVHTDGQGNFVWAPAFSPNVVELTGVDADAGTITFEAEIIGGTSRVVPGSRLGVPLEELEAGDSVEVAISYAIPGEDEALIVWLAPVE